MNRYEAAHNAAHECFKLEFEDGLRKRLMLEAAAQVEHIVHEYSKRLFVETNSYVDQRELAQIHVIKIKDTNLCALR